MCDLVEARQRGRATFVWTTAPRAVGDRFGRRVPRRELARRSLIWRAVASPSSDLLLFRDHALIAEDGSRGNLVWGGSHFFWSSSFGASTASAVRIVAVRFFSTPRSADTFGERVWGVTGSRVPCETPWNCPPRLLSAGILFHRG